MLLQNLLQPLLLTFVFGRVLTTSGMMQAGYKNVLLPGIIGISMVMSGVWAVAMPLITEFQFTREIEDRLLAPIEIGWLAVEKIVAGHDPGAGGRPGGDSLGLAGDGLGRQYQLPPPAPVRRHLPAGGAVFGRRRAGAGVQHRPDADRPDVQPGDRAHDDVRLRLLPWSALRNFPGLQYAVLINPLVYASEGLRGALVPQVPHIPIAAVFAALVAINLILLAVGMKKFYGKAIG